MFLSFELKPKIYRDVKGMNGYQYSIIDSDFKESRFISTSDDNFNGWGELIKSYEKRDLPVASNLMKALLWYGKKHNFNIKELISWNKQYNQKFQQYEEEINKYLILL